MGGDGILFHVSTPFVAIANFSVKECQRCFPTPENTPGVTRKQWDWSNCLFCKRQVEPCSLRCTPLALDLKEYAVKLVCVLFYTQCKLVKQPQILRTPGWLDKYKVGIIPQDSKSKKAPELKFRINTKSTIKKKSSGACYIVINCCKGLFTLV